MFGNVIDSVLWAAHCPVAVTRLLNSPTKIQRILIPIENITPQAVRNIKFASMLAAETGAHIVALHVCERRASSAKIAWMRSQLSLLIDKLALSNHPEIQIKPHDNIPQAIQQVAEDNDLVVLRSTRRRTSAAGGLAIADLTTQIVAALNCSIVMLGEPQPAHNTFFASSSRVEITATRHQ
jgi:nucleotide-binding universal stress UspA family protein